MSSAELARVREIESEPGNPRAFMVGNDGQKGESEVTYYDAPVDMLFCDRHRAWDSCTCTARVRLCGILTNSVVPDVVNYKRSK